MAQWNNGYYGNNLYPETSSWTDDVSGQHGNQANYMSGQDVRNDHFGNYDIITQMQGVSIGSNNFSNHATNYQQFQNYENTYTYPQTSSGGPNHSMQHLAPHSTNNYEEPYSLCQPNTFNDTVLKSNLTPTASEFVPKHSTVSSVDANQSNNAETSTSHIAKQDNFQSTSSSTNWREKGPEGSGSYRGGNRSQQYNYRTNDSHNNEQSRGRYTSYERNSNNIPKNSSKIKYKPKPSESDAPRTFFNSTINRTQNDVYTSRERYNTRKNWVGSQRVQGVNNRTLRDEQNGRNSIQSKDKNSDRNRPESTPIKRRQKFLEETATSELTQRERLSKQLDAGTLECLVCCEYVKPVDQVWSCRNCYHVLHLRCVRKWADRSLVEGKWRCPACQNEDKNIPTEYRCMCGSVRNPDYVRGTNGAHTCGKSCKRQRNCPHPCMLLCHPGPCPPCQATVSKKCGCGAETRSVLCSSKLVQLCERVCNRTLSCGQHTCTRNCHDDPCEPCKEMVEQVCYCPASKSRTVLCEEHTSKIKQWSCDGECGRVLECGNHVCRTPCHLPPCNTCELLPSKILTCPCGKTRIDKNLRKSCTDVVPVCGNICAKPLACGPPGDRHFCKQVCHEGPCPVCPEKTSVQCRCGHSTREVPCGVLPQMYNNVFCQKKCNKKFSCGRHRCRMLCCAMSVHRCNVICGRMLSCQIHRCEQLCHTGHCAPCSRLGFEELSCECGAEVIFPPIRCGARPPVCNAPCTRPRDCGHPPHHSCHSGDCPPCVVLTAKRCHGEHEERKTIPCSQEEFSCGLPCGKPLICGKHTCIKTCHKGPCNTGTCTQPCVEKRPSCGHDCAAACHVASSTPCPSGAPCRRVVRAICPCGRRSAERMCAENARDYAKMMSTLAASKMQDGESVDLTEVQRPKNMLKTLECDDGCRQEARNRQLALALQIRNPDVSSKLAPRYSEHVRAMAGREPVFAQQVHDQLVDLVQRAKKSKQKTRSHSFPSMNWQKRQFIHEMCEQFGCESVAYDAEPNRNVVATADREKSWLPAMSVLELLARESGKRRVPRPMLRGSDTSAIAAGPSGVAAQPSRTTPAKTSSGWASLTSTNAWTARSQSRQQQQAQQSHSTQAQPSTSSKPSEKQQLTRKIDYFDNPPEN